MTTARLTLLALAGALVATGASAHERSVSHSAWRLDPEGARVELRVSARDVERLLEAPALAGDREAGLQAYLLTRLRLASEQGPCTVRPGSFRPLSPERGSAAWEWRVACAGALRTATVESHFFEEIAPHHLHFARIAEAGGVMERVLTEGHRAVSFEVASPQTKTRVIDYVRLGIDHILTGYDHLAFLLALLVGAPSLGALLRVVTGFTVGHSLTLALAVLGWLHPDTRLVEATIGISIVVVAVENVWVSSGERRLGMPVITVAGLLGAAAMEAWRVPAAALALLGVAVAAACYFGLIRAAAHASALRGAVATGFGLVHGLGFASVLTQHPLPAARLVPALVGFNLGVEIGQLAAAATAWLVLRAIASRLPRLYDWVTPVASAATCGAGVFWALTRLP
jgi:hypothetical protein